MSRGKRARSWARSVHVILDDETVKDGKTCLVVSAAGSMAGEPSQLRRMEFADVGECVLALDRGEVLRESGGSGDIEIELTEEILKPNETA